VPFLELDVYRLINRDTVGTYDLFSRIKICEIDGVIWYIPINAKGDILTTEGFRPGLPIDSTMLVGFDTVERAHQAVELAVIESALQE
jgi:hypothetical protein